MEKKGRSKNIRINKIIKTVIAITIVIFTCFLLTNNVFAEGEILDVSSLLTNIGLMFLWFIRLVVLLIVIVIYAALSFLFTGSLISVDEIFFSKIPLLNLDFLITPGGGESGSSIISSISKGYWIIFYIVIGIQFLLLIYSMVRYLIQSKTSGKTEGPQEELLAWAKGMFMLFATLVISFAMVYLNNYICVALDTAITRSDVLSGDMLINLAVRSLQGIGPDANISFILCVGLVVTTIIMFFYYMRRAIRIGFLVAIAPLVSLTYSLSGGKKSSKGFSTWFNEFSSNLFIQLFHILIYIAFVVPLATFGLVQETSSLFEMVPSLVLAFFGLAFIFSAENLVRSIFEDKIKRSEVTGKSIATMLVAKDIAKKTIDTTKKVKDSAEKHAKRKVELRKNNDYENYEGVDNTNTPIDRDGETYENGQGDSYNNNPEEGNGENADQNTNPEEENLEVSDEVLAAAGVEDAIDEEAEDNNEAITGEDENYSDDSDEEEKNLTKFQRAKLAFKRSSARKYKKLSTSKGVEDKKRKKKFPAKLKNGSKTLAKYGLKAGAMYAGAIMGQAAHEEMVAGTVAGALAGGKLFDMASDKAKNSRGITKKKKNKNYQNAVRNSAKSQVNSSQTAGELGTRDNDGNLVSFNADATTEDGRRNIRNYYKDVYNKQNNKDKTGESQLDKEYKKAYAEFIKGVQKDEGLSGREAATVADELIDLILSGKKLEISELHDYERELLKAVNDQQIAIDLVTLKEYTDPLEKNEKVGMQKEIVEDPSGEDMGSIEDMVMLIGEETLEMEENNQQPDKVDLRDELDRLYDDNNLENKYRNNRNNNYKPNNGNYYEDDEQDEEDDDQNM